VRNEKGRQQWQNLQPQSTATTATLDRKVPEVIRGTEVSKRIRARVRKAPKMANRDKVVAAVRAADAAVVEVAANQPTNLASATRAPQPKTTAAAIAADRPSPNLATRTQATTVAATPAASAGVRTAIAVANRNRAVQRPNRTRTAKAAMAAMEAAVSANVAAAVEGEAEETRRCKAAPGSTQSNSTKPHSPSGGAKNEMVSPSVGTSWPCMSREAFAT